MPTDRSKPDGYVGLPAIVKQLFLSYQLHNDLVEEAKNQLLIQFQKGSQTSQSFSWTQVSHYMHVRSLIELENFTALQFR